MKALVIILLFCTTYCIGEKDKLSLQKFPKKVATGHKLYLNVKRYAKNEPISTQKTNINKGYTVFQAVPNDGKLNVPESQYFHYEPLVEQKTRVKKVLPMHGLSRRKRYAENKELAAKNTERVKHVDVNIKDDTERDLKTTKKDKQAKGSKLRSKTKKIKAYRKGKKDKISSEKVALKVGNEDNNHNKPRKVTKTKHRKTNKNKSKKTNKKLRVAVNKSNKGN